MNLREIAAALGVSPASVSIVRKGLPGVSAATRRRIAQLLSENGYAYQEYACAPASAASPDHQKARFIRLIKFRRSALLVDQNEGFVEAIIDSADTHARTHGYTLSLSAISHAEYPAFLRDLAASDCAGLLVLATEMNREEILALACLPQPLVVIDSDYPALPFCTVTMHNRDVAYTAVSRLFALGHAQVGHLRSSIPTGNFDARGVGYREALCAHDCAYDEALCFSLRPSVEGAYADMLSLLHGAPRMPTAFFADNDVIAAGAMRALTERGYAIPDDISIIGVDNTPLSPLCAPPLSSMQISRFTLGKCAFRALLDQIRHPAQEPVHIRIGAQLIERASCAPPPAPKINGAF